MKVKTKTKVDPFDTLPIPTRTHKICYSHTVKLRDHLHDRLLKYVDFLGLFAVAIVAAFLLLPLVPQAAHDGWYTYAASVAGVVLAASACVSGRLRFRIDKGMDQWHKEVMECVHCGINEKTYPSNVMTCPTCPNECVIPPF